MSIKKYLPSLEELEETLREDGLRMLYIQYGRHDSIIGPVDSCDFIEEKREEYLQLRDRLTHYQKLHAEAKQKRGIFNWIWKVILSREINLIFKKL